MTTIVTVVVPLPLPLSPFPPLRYGKVERPQGEERGSVPFAGTNNMLRMLLVHCEGHT